MKEFFKKLALFVGSLILLITAGGVISASASSFKPATPAMDKAEETNGYYIGTSPSGATGPSHVGKAMNQERASIFTYNGNRYEMADNGNVAKDLGPVVTSNGNSANGATASDVNQASQSTENGRKLVQTGENNGAEYAATAGVILAISGVALAGYDFRKNA